MKLQNALAEIAVMVQPLANELSGPIATRLGKVGNHLDMARTDLRRFLDERELAGDAVEEIEEIIKCLE